MTKRQGISIHLELFPKTGAADDGFWGGSFAMDGAGGSVDGKSPDPLATYDRLARRLRAELKKYLETREQKSARLAKRKDALRRSKDRGTLG